VLNDQQWIALGIWESDDASCRLVVGVLADRLFDGLFRNSDALQ